MTDTDILTQFSKEVRELGHKKSRSVCEYCGCNHKIRLTTDGPDYLLQAGAGACHQYIRDIHNEIRAIRNRLGLDSNWSSSKSALTYILSVLIESAKLGGNFSSVSRSSTSTSGNILHKDLSETDTPTLPRYFLTRQLNLNFDIGFLFWRSRI